MAFFAIISLSIFLSFMIIFWSRCDENLVVALAAVAD
jgi:hypothetical protein